MKDLRRIAGITLFDDTRIQSSQLLLTKNLLLDPA